MARGRQQQSKPNLEAHAAVQVNARELPKAIREFRLRAVRRWRFDFARPEHKLAVEVQGGAWSGGAHGRGSGITRNLGPCLEGLLEAPMGDRPRTGGELAND